jgi:N-acetylmuramoyl-L-alanine amidase
MGKVGVDDGHGMETAGKRTPDGYRENEFNHFTKVYLMDALKRCGITPIDCSPDRTDNSLQNRCDICNQNHCDIFVSIHFNAMGNVWRDDVGGIETYFWSGNSINSDGGRLATLVHNELIKGTPLKNRGVKSADFYVLHYTNPPAILCECGFMDNPNEAALMKSDSYRKECSEEICKGICNYFNIPYIAPPVPITPSFTEREIVIDYLNKVSNWSAKYVNEFDQLQANNINVYGVINKIINYVKGENK